MNQNHFFASMWTIIWLIIFLMVLYFSYQSASEHLIYTLDDPYISLRVAQIILNSGYGINIDEFSSPASSILYPFILTLPLALGFGCISPLIINLLATGTSVWLLIDFYWQHAGKKSTFAIYPQMICLLLIFSINAWSLPLSGMEHSLHILLVIIAMRALVRLAEQQTVSIGLIWATILMPFIRFEGMALSLAIIWALIINRCWRLAIFSGFMIVLGFMIWFIIMHQLGLPYLPSSVLVKSNISDLLFNGAWFEIFNLLIQKVCFPHPNHFALIFLLSLAALIATTQDSKGIWRSFSHGKGLVIWVVVFSLIAHILCGNYGWFYRYEVYCVTILVMGGIYLSAPILIILDKNKHQAGILGVVMALGVIVSPYFNAVWETPRASKLIYQQQFQMHRFATEFFPHRVAVNDLGWVSYDNKAFVLDLWGLGSELSRKLRRNNHFNPQMIRALANAKAIDYVMIYREWFLAVPEEWCLIAKLHTTPGLAKIGSVFFYLTHPALVDEMNQSLDQFAKTLPQGVALEKIEHCDDQQP